MGLAGNLQGSGKVLEAATGVASQSFSVFSLALSIADNGSSAISGANSLTQLKGRVGLAYDAVTAGISLLTPAASIMTFGITMAGGRDAVLDFAITRWEEQQDAAYRRDNDVRQ